MNIRKCRKITGFYDKKAKEEAAHIEEISLYGRDGVIQNKSVYIYFGEALVRKSETAYMCGKPYTEHSEDFAAFEGCRLVLYSDETGMGIRREYAKEAQGILQYNDYKPKAYGEAYTYQNSPEIVKEYFTVFTQEELEYYKES